MIIKEAELIAVAVNIDQYPPDTMKEIAFAGRSNVGKSSLLNMMIKRKALARVSGNPGKTRTINFYEINGDFRIVDLPGYGYAKVSRCISENWGEMVERYLQNREGLLKVIQLVDIRHAPSKEDIQMTEYLRHYNLDGFVVATKADKVSRNEVNKSLNLIRKTLNLSEGDRIIPVSVLKKTGYEDLMEAMDAIYQL